MSKSRLVLAAAIAALLLAFGPASMAQDTEEHHDPAAPGAAAPPLPGADAAPGQGSAGGPSGGMGMGMMGMGGTMMDLAHMREMHEMMMRMHGVPGGMGMMPGMMPGMGMGMGPGMMTGMGMVPGMGMSPGMMTGMGMAPGMMPGMGMPGMPSPGMGMMPGMGMPGMPSPGMGMAETALLAGEDPLAAGLAAVNRRMHREMSQPGSGDADIDFARAMIAHHKGAVDMAKLVLAFGDDPEIRKLAEGVIAAQTEEIRTLEAWLGRNQP